jgi:hypothetical protein
VTISGHQPIGGDDPRWPVCAALPERAVRVAGRLLPAVPLRPEQAGLARVAGVLGGLAPLLAFVIGELLRHRRSPHGGPSLGRPP